MRIPGNTRLLTRNKAPRRLAASLFVLQLGAAMTTVGLPLLMVRDYGLSLDTGIVLGLRLLPNILFGALVGDIVDRFDPRKVAALSAVASAVVVAMFPISTALWQLQMLAFLAGITYLFGLPARIAMLPRVIEAGAEVEGNSLIVSASRLASLLGPAVAGPILAAVGINWLFDIEALTAAVAAMLILGMDLRAPIDERQSRRCEERPTEEISGRSRKRRRALDAARRLTEEARNALRLLRRAAAGPAHLVRILQRDPVVMALTITSFTYVFAVSLGRIFLIKFATSDLPGTPGAYAYLLAAMGAGATVGGLIAARLRRFHQGWLYLLGNLLEGLCWLGMPFVSVLWMALSIMFLAGLFESVATVVYFAEAQARLPNEYLGRYYAILVPLTDVFSAGGSALGAPVVSGVSLPWSATVICLLIVAPVLVVARLFAWKRGSTSAPPSLSDRILPTRSWPPPTTSPTQG